MGTKKKQPKIIFVCEKCGKAQKPDKKQSTDNWNVFDAHEKCECGGKFVMKIEE